MNVYPDLTGYFVDINGACRKTSGGPVVYWLTEDGSFLSETKDCVKSYLSTGYLNELDH